VNCALPQTGDDTSVSEDEALHRTVIRQHCNHRVAPAGVPHLGGVVRALLYQRLRLAGGAVVNSDFMPTL
jgi:hypothetical protein